MNRLYKRKFIQDKKTLDISVTFYLVVSALCTDIKFVWSRSIVLISDKTDFEWPIFMGLISWKGCSGPPWDSDQP